MWWCLIQIECSASHVDLHIVHSRIAYSEVALASWAQLLWCDLRKPITCCKIDILSLILVSCESLNHPFPRPFYMDLLWYWYQSYWCSKGIKNKVKKNIRIMLLISFVLQFQLLHMWQVFPDHITIMCIVNVQFNYMYVENIVRFHN